MFENPSGFESESNNEAIITSFIVRIWSVESASTKIQEIWRGHITPVPYGKRLYFTNIEKIPDLIRSYLKAQKR